ncbi:MAG TPA: LamG domain-containing protein [bacterium]|nr:LamG domain-containing protein [bacterium]
MKYWFLVVLTALFLAGSTVAQEGGEGAKLMLKIDFEEPISGNGSGVFAASSGTQETKWGKTVAAVATTAMAKDGKPWLAEHRVPGKTGQAYLFGGDEDKRYITVPYSEAIETGKSDFSISVWIKTVETSGLILLKTTTAPYWVVHLDKGKPRLMLNDGTGPTIALAARQVVNDGLWHHVVLTVKSNDALRFYVDGKVDGEVSFVRNLADMTKKAAIGIGGYGYPNWYFKGAMDSLRLYRGALTADQVKQLFNEG